MPVERRVRRRRTRYAAAPAAAVLATLLVAPAGSLVPAASAARATLPGTLDTRAQQTATISVPVPAGVDPRWVTGALTVGDESAGTVLLLVDGEVRREVPARPWQRVAVPVGRADVRPDGTLRLGLRFRPAGQSTGCRPVEEHDVRLANLTLLHRGSEDVDLSAAGFLPDAASRVDVVVPRNATDDVLDAGLATVAALAARYPADVPVGLTTADVVLPRAGAGQRVVRLSPGEPGAGVETSAAVRFGLPNLSVTGSGEELRRAAVDLVGAPAPAPAGADSSDERPEAGETVTRSLADLGATAADAELSGYGRSASVLRIPQDALGGPVDRLDVVLRGASTSVAPGTQARLDTYLDDRLVDSHPLAEGGAFTVETTVPGSRLRPTTELTLALTAVPPDGSCTAGTLLPLQVQLDREASSMTATIDDGEVDPTRGDGFADLPQALRGELPVALRGEGPARTAAAADAALVVASLQRAAAGPLDVRLVAPDDLLADGPGLLVGATWADTVAVDVGLRPDPAGPPGAALQVGAVDGRPVLVLGTLGERSARMRTWVAEEVTRRGWDRLPGGALVSAGGAARPLADLDPATVPGEVAEPVADLVPTEEERSYVGWFVGGIGVLLALLGAQLAAAVRRRRTSGRTSTTAAAAESD